MSTTFFLVLKAVRTRPPISRSCILNATGKSIAGNPVKNCWSCKSKTFERLEPCAGKLARTVFRGEWRSNAPFLPGALFAKDGARYLEDDTAITAFDFDSIMVACIQGATRAFSVGVPKLSAGDIYGLVKTYGPAPENVLDADEPGDRFGHSIAVGDFNGDAIPDLAVGAPGESLADSGDASGAVYLYKGDATGGLRPWARLIGNNTQGFGETLTADRLDADNRADLIVGSADGTVTAFQGRSRKPPTLWDGPPPALTASPAVSPMVSNAGTPYDVQPFDLEPGSGSGSIGFGHASLLVDLDLDGHQDLIVTAPEARIDGAASGQVFIYRSPDTAHPWNPKPQTFTPWYRFGQSH